MASGQMGNGDWDFVGYVSQNHPGVTFATIGGTSYTINPNSGKSVPATPPSRYDVYRWEIETSRIPMAPANNTTTPARPDIDRRVFTAAALDCQALDASGGMVAGRDLPVTGFVEVFLTEPVGSGSEPTIYGEVVGDALSGIENLAQERPEVVR